MHTSQKRHDGPLRSPPPRALASGGEGLGVGGRVRFTATPPTRHVAFGAAPPSPPLARARGGRDGARCTVSALQKMCACPARRRGPITTKISVTPDPHTLPCCRVGLGGPPPRRLPGPG